MISGLLAMGVFVGLAWVASTLEGRGRAAAGPGAPGVSSPADLRPRWGGRSWKRGGAL